MNEGWQTYIFEKPTPQRLDHFLASCLLTFSRSRIQALIKEGFVLVNDNPAKKSGQSLETGFSVNIFIPPDKSSEIIPEDIALDVLYEDQDVIVINKPSGMVVHPAVGHTSGTLVNAALHHTLGYASIGGEKRPGIVHRLDKDTSGILIIAKNDLAHRFLQNQFRDRQVQKIYLALVDGHPPTPNGKIDAAIHRDRKARKQMAIVADNQGKTSISSFYTIHSFQKHTLLEIHPLTGRTHQIRLHLAFLGCPIVGDTIYGHKQSSLPLKRHFLHAAHLSITLPSKSVQRTFDAPLPSDLIYLLEQLGLPKEEMISKNIVFLNNKYRSQ